jgi:hypothetical protein
MAAGTHAFLFEEGAWSATGTFFDRGEAARPARGRTVVRHGCDAWTIEGSMTIDGDTPVTIENAYEIVPPSDLGAPISWSSRNPLLGRLDGTFAVVDEFILSSFTGAEAGAAGSETLLRLACDRYRAVGVLVSAGAVVSTWSMVLVRAG